MISMGYLSTFTRTALRIFRITCSIKVADVTMIPITIAFERKFRTPIRAVCIYPDLTQVTRRCCLNRLLKNQYFKIKILFVEIIVAYQLREDAIYPIVIILQIIDIVANVAWL